MQKYNDKWTIFVFSNGWSLLVASENEHHSTTVMVPVYVIQTGDVNQINTHFAWPWRQIHVNDDDLGHILALTASRPKIDTPGESIKIADNLLARTLEKFKGSRK